MLIRVLFLVFACSQGHFQGGFRVLFYGWRYARWHWCFVWTLEYEVARRGFPDNLSSHEIIHEFGKYAGHSTFDWISVRVQNVYKNIGFKRRWPLTRPSKGSTILILYTQWWSSGHAVQGFVHFTKLGLDEGIFVWQQDDMTNVCYLIGSRSLINPTPWGMDRKSSKIYVDLFNVGKKCAKRTSQDLYEIPTTHWLRIKIAFIRHWWHPISIHIHVWYKYFGHKTEWQSWSLRSYSSSTETSAKS